jgi:hypothetical protein
LWIGALLKALPYIKYRVGNSRRLKNKKVGYLAVIGTPIDASISYRVGPTKRRTYYIAATSYINLGRKT